MNTGSKLLWTASTAADIDQYQRQLDVNLSHIVLPVNALYCKNRICNDHKQELQLLHDNIIEACVNASKCIPSTKPKHNKCVPGWIEFVKET